MSRFSALLHNKKIWLRLLLGAAILLFSYGLSVLCEATAQQEFSTFSKFYATGLSRLVLRNTTLMVAMLILALYLLTTKLSVSVALVGIPMFVIHCINAFKLLFRNEPLYPWDFSLASEVTNIVGSMKISFSPPMIWTVCYVVAGIALAIVADVCWLKKFRQPYKRAWLGGLCVLVLLVCTCTTMLNEHYLIQKQIDTVAFDQATSYRTNGFLYSFTSNLYKSKVKAPEGYDQQSITQLAFEYNDPTRSTVKKPNIIIVMSEAFSDIWNAEHLHFKQEVAPNFTALSKKYLTGNAMTSEFGGNTANCEFEMLTSYTTALLPTGTVAYMNYVNGTVDSYVSFLNRQNYYTVALHPYLRSFFSREKAYEVLGFDDFYSEEHFEGAQRLRLMQYISDDAVADRIIEEFEKNEESGKPFFCHTVTMQNHASYFEKDLPLEEQIKFTTDVELSDEEFAVLRSYASGLHLADAALGKLVDYFEEVDEPTVLLFFGDHQPSLHGETRELLERIGYTADRESDEGTLALQSTPFLIWNNFEDKPTHEEQTMSMFHLVPYMTRTLGLPRPAFHTYMDSLYSEVQGMTRQVYCNSEGSAVDQLSATEQKKFDEYLSLVYDGLMGKRYANPILYS